MEIGAAAVLTGTLTQPDFGSKKYLSSELSFGKTDTLFIFGNQTYNECGGKIACQYTEFWKRKFNADSRYGTLESRDRKSVV